MTTTGLELRLREGSQKAAVTRFTKTLDDVVLSLREIDQLYFKHGSRPKWVIQSVNQQHSESVIRFEPRSKSRTRDIQDMQVPIDLFVDGVRSLDDRAEIPKLYAPDTVKRIERIGNGTEDYSRISFATYNGSINKVAVLSHAVRTNAALAVKHSSLAYGALSGVLDTLGTSKNGLRVRVFDKQTERAVDGSADRSLAEELRQLWNHRVLVSGPIYRNVSGQPVRIEIERIEKLPAIDKPMVDAATLLGISPNWIDGLSVENYIRSVRGA